MNQTISDLDSSHTLRDLVDGWHENGGGMHLTVDRVLGIPVIHIDGPLVLGDPTSMLRQTAAVLNASSDFHFVVDLASATKIDSAGLGSLLMIATAAHRNGGFVTAVPPLKDYVGNVLVQTKLDTVIPLYELLSDALYHVFLHMEGL